MLPISPPAACSRFIGEPRRCAPSNPKPGAETSASPHPSPSRRFGADREAPRRRGRGQIQQKSPHLDILSSSFCPGLRCFVFCRGAIGDGFAKDAGSTFTLALRLFWGGSSPQAFLPFSGSPSPFPAHCQGAGVTWVIRVPAGKVSPGWMEREHGAELSSQASEPRL